MHPRAVDNNELGIALHMDSIDLAPGRLRSAGDNGDLGSQNLIQQTRLADIGPAHQSGQHQKWPGLFNTGFLLADLPQGLQRGHLFCGFAAAALPGRD